MFAVSLIAAEVVVVAECAPIVTELVPRSTPQIPVITVIASFPETSPFKAKPVTAPIVATPTMTWAIVGEIFITSFLRPGWTRPRRPRFH